MHVRCKAGYQRPQSLTFSQAALWRTPIVRKRWLVDSAAAGKPLPYDAFLTLTADHQPEQSASDQRCGRVSCSSKLTSGHAAEPSVNTARARGCKSPPQTSASVEPWALAHPGATAVRSTSVTCETVHTKPAEQQGAHDAEAASWPPEPELRRAAITASDAHAFGLDDLQPLHSPGASLCAVPKMSHSTLSVKLETVPGSEWMRS